MTIGNIIQIALAQDSENGDTLMVLTDEGKVYEQTHPFKRVCYGTYQTGTDESPKSVEAVRTDRYVVWREIVPSLKESLIHKGQENYRVARGFKPCEEREAS